MRSRAPTPTEKGDNSFDTHRYRVTIGVDLMTLSRDDPMFRQRMTLTMDADGRKIVSKGEMSRDGAPWEGDLELTFERL